MRIGIITSSYPRTPADSSSAGVFVRDFAHALRAQGSDVLVLTPQRVESDDRVNVVSFPWPGDDPSLTHLDPKQPINLLRLGALMISGVFSTIRTFRSWRPDHVMAMWAVPSGLLAWTGRKVLRRPYAVWALGSDIWRIQDYPLGRTILRTVLRGADQRYADGMELARDVQRVSGRDCGFLASGRILPSPDSGSTPSLDPASTHLLCVARFHPHKGVDVLIDAVAGLPQDVKSAIRVHVFGDGPQRTELERRVRDQGLEEVVRLGGYIGPDELSAYLRAVRCLIIPSRIESIPLILSDAAQAGSPVIATETGDLGRLVREYGVGYVVPPGSAADLATCISRVHREGMKFDPDGAKRLAEHLSVGNSALRFLERIETP